MPFSVYTRLSDDFWFLRFTNRLLIHGAIQPLVATFVLWYTACLLRWIYNVCSHLK